jgi:septum formation topological specificity factor MinE
MLITNQRKDFSSEDLLAALQAQIIYMIMRFVDGASEPVDLNQQLVITYQVSVDLRSTQ